MVLRWSALILAHLWLVGVVAAQEGLPDQLPESALEPPTEFAASILTLTDLEQLALQNNPSLARSVALAEAMRGKWLQSGLYPNPTVGYNSMSIGNLGTAGQQGAQVGQRIVTGGKLSLNRKISEQEVRQALYEVEVQKQRVLSDVRIQFYNVLVAQERMRLTTDLWEISNAAVQASSQLHKNRQTGLNDVLQARIETDKTEILFGQAQYQHAAAWRKLAAVMGTPAMAPTPVQGSLDSGLLVYTWQETLAFLLANSPEMAGAQANVDRARWKVKREKVEPIPDIDVMVTAAHNNESGDNIVNVQAGFVIPVFNRNQGNIQQAHFELAAALSDLRRVEVDLQARLAEVFQGYQNALLQVQKYQGRILPNARESLDLVRKGYENQQINYLTLLLSQRTYFEANLDYLDALRELRESEAVLRGLLLRGSLQAGK
jgi:cobalt-zinc-cadmium efflux system outer membrane protein